MNIRILVDSAWSDTCLSAKPGNAYHVLYDGNIYMYYMITMYKCII